MKSIKILFLFCVFSILCFLGNQKAFAQQQTDSAFFYSQLLKKPIDPSSLTSVYSFFDNSYKQSLLKGKTLAAIQNLRYMASIENTLGSSYESEATSVEALKLLEELKIINATIEPRTGIYNHLGIIYRNRKDYEKAIEFYNKVLDIAQTQEQENKVHLNIGNVYKDQEKYKLALDAYTKVYNNIKNSKNELLIANSLDNIGFIQSKLNEPQALQNLEKALELKLKTNNLKRIYKSYSNLREYYKDRNDKDKALEYAYKSYDVAKQINSSSYVFDALSYLIGFSNDEKIIEFKRLNDSIEDFKSQSRNKYAALKYEKETESKRADNSQRIKERWILISIVLGLLFLFIYSFQKSKHKKDKLQQVFNTESRISKKVHDEVANDVFQVMTKLQSTQPNDELLDDIEQIYNKTRDISKEHSVIDLEGDFENVLNDLILSYNDIDTNVIAKGISEVNWDAISELKRVTTYKVLQELLINMKKHSKATVVVLTFDSNRKTILINYSDNGIGCDLKKGTGLQNVENRIVSINGTITFDSEIDKGFKVKLTV